MIGFVFTYLKKKEKKYTLYEVIIVNWIHYNPPDHSIQGLSTILLTHLF